MRVFIAPQWHRGNYIKYSIIKYSNEANNIFITFTTIIIGYKSIKSRGLGDS